MLIVKAEKGGGRKALYNLGPLYSKVKLKFLVPLVVLVYKLYRFRDPENQLFMSLSQDLKFVPRICTFSHHQH